MKTREQFLTSIRRNRMPAVFRDDNGIWHGQDFLFPGCPESIGTTVDKLPIEAKHCENGCCDCYIYMSPEAHMKEFGW